MAVGDIINTSTLTQTFDDEFNSFAASPNGATGLWRTTLLNGDRTLGSNGEEEYYSDSSVGVNPFSLNNGVLTIQAAPAASGSNPLGLPYTSGVITTENSFNQLYGYFEIDAKMPAGQGLWPAFWLLPASGAWPPELDAFEVLGNNPDTLYFSAHSADQATEGTALTVANVSAGYNLYGVMWGPKTVDLYINNVEVASMPTPPDMNVPMYMLANLAVGGYWPGDPNSTTPFPADMNINYVRAYAYPGTTGGTVYDTTAAQNNGPAPLAPVVTLPAAVTVPVDVTAAVKGLSFTSNWPGGFFTVQISDSKGAVTTSTTSDVFTKGEDSNYLTLTGNLEPLNTALASLSYDGPGGEYVWVTVTDPQGLKSSAYIAVAEGSIASTGTTTSSGGGTISSGGAAPVIDAPGSLSVGADAAVAVSGVSIADSQGGEITVTLSDSTGLLKTQAETGVTAKGEDSLALTLSGTAAALNLELATLTYTAGSGAGSDWLWVSASDQGGTQGLGHVVVTTTLAGSGPVTGTPAVTTPATLSTSTGAVAGLSGVSIADPQGSATLSVIVSDSVGLLNTQTVSGVAAHGEDSTALTLTGTVAELNTALASLSYTAGGAGGADWLWVSANDPDGKQGLGHVVVTTALSAAPVIDPPATISVAAGATQTIPDVSLADRGYAGTITLTVSDKTGLLSTDASAGVTAKGEHSTTLSLTGTVTELNVALESLAYQASGTPGAEWLWLSAETPGTPEALAHIVVNTTAPVAVPVVTTPAAVTLAAGAATALEGIHVAASGSGTIAVAVSDSAGLLNVAVGSGVVMKGEGTDVLTLNGSVAAVNAALDSLTYTAHGSAAADWLWVSATNTNGVQGLNHEVVHIAGGTTQAAAESLSPASSGLAALIDLADSGGGLAVSLTSSGTATESGAALYGLKITAAGTVAGLPVAPQALQAVVGGADQSTLTLASVSGFSATKLTFLYPADASGAYVNATGLRANAVFLAGPGADIFTGGSGVNDYVFGATSHALADEITNFNPQKDLLDFAGAAGKLHFAGLIEGTTLAAESVGFVTAGGDTYVYANTGGVAETLAHANARVELLGNLKLSAANFVV